MLKGCHQSWDGGFTSAIVTCLRYKLPQQATSTKIRSSSLYFLSVLDLELFDQFVQPTYFLVQLFCGSGQFLGAGG